MVGAFEEQGSKTQLTLSRLAVMPFGTFGFLRGPGFEFATVERPWKENERYVSCVPDGRYVLSPRRFHRGGYDTWELVDVPLRDHILIHIANIPEEVQGCIGIGRAHGCVNGRWAVIGSKDAFADFSRAMDMMDIPISLVVRRET